MNEEIKTIITTTRMMLSARSMKREQAVISLVTCLLGEGMSFLWLGPEQNN